MQLLRVASTMSYQGSPYSGPGDEYDFEDDGYDDIEEYRSPEDTLQQPPAEDSDEGKGCLTLFTLEKRSLFWRRITCQMLIIQ